MILETEQYFINQKNLIEEYIKQNINSASDKLKEAMLYSTLNGGKKFRGILCLTSFDSFESPNHLEEAKENIISLAAGIEYIHAMSLIHDDLPCMDNDDFRRGKPTCHKQFNEAIALLAGDGLLIDGISLFLKSYIAEANKLKCLQILLDAVGANGMVAGQALDMTPQNSIETLQQIHLFKTAVFIGASAAVGITAKTLDEKYIRAFYEFGKNIGLAFQIIDDILDITSTTEKLGKTQGKDEEQNKLTYPSIFGIEKSQKMAEELIIEAKDYLSELEYIKTDRLFGLAHLVISRDK